MSGNCDQVCKNSNGSFSCSCVPGYLLSTADNHTCTAVNVPETEEPSIIFANSVDIQHISIDGKPVSSKSKIATHETLALDYLHRNRTVCWISHAHLATSRQKRDLTGIAYRRGIAKRLILSTKKLFVSFTIHQSSLYVANGPSIFPLVPESVKSDQINSSN